MRTFKDNAGREWSVALNVGTLRQIRSLSGADLASVAHPDSDLLERLASDPVLLCEVVYAACRSEAETKGISEDDFYAAMAGDAIDHATTALLEELGDFFRNPRQRALFAALLRKAREFETKALDLAERRMESLDLDAEVEKLTSGLSSTNSPESPESIPTP